MRRRLLITGLSGFLGAHCAWRLRHAWDTTGTVHKTSVAVPGVRRVPLNLADPARVRDVITRHAPHTILHTAAMTHPEECERAPARATAINVHGTAALCGAARAVGARVVYLSTDLVFDGRDAPYDEDALPRPLSHYGRTKLEGEGYVHRLGGHGCTLRTSILYGWPRGPHGCFLEWFVGALDGPEPVRLFTDQYRAFLYIADAVEMIARVLARPALPPLLHLAGPERTSRYAFGEQFCRILGYDTTRIAPGRMRDLANFTARPTDCTMRPARFVARYHFRPRSVQRGLRALQATAPTGTFEDQAPA